MPVVSVLVALAVTLGLSGRAMWVWWKKDRSGLTPRRTQMGTVAIGAVLLNCVWFAVLLMSGSVGGFGMHYVTTRRVDLYLLGSVVVTVGGCLARGESRLEAVLAGVVTTNLWLGAGLVA